MLGCALIGFIISVAPGGLTNLVGELLIAELLMPKDFSDPEEELNYVCSPVRGEILL